MKVFIGLFLIALVATASAQDARRGGRGGKSQHGNRGGAIGGGSGSRSHGGEGSAASHGGDHGDRTHRGHHMPEACKADFEKYCPKPEGTDGSKPTDADKKAMKECVMNNFNSFSAECKAELPCMEDEIKFCKAEILSGDRDAIKECNEKNFDSFSTECKAFIEAKKSHGGKSDGGKRHHGGIARIPEECKAEVEAKCPKPETTAEVSEDDKKAFMECLINNFHSFSTECKAAMPCAEDEFKYCKAELLSGDRDAVKECTLKNFESFSTECKTFIENQVSHHGEPGDAPRKPKVDRTPPATCDADFAEYCPPSIETSHRTCVAQNLEKFSSDCQAQLPCFADILTYCAVNVDNEDWAGVITCLKANVDKLAPTCQERVSRVKNAPADDTVTVEAEIAELGYVPSSMTEETTAAPEVAIGGDEDWRPHHREGRDHDKKQWYETTGFYIGAAVAGVVCLAAVVALAVVLRRRKRAAREQGNMEPHVSLSSHATYSPPRSVDVLPSAPVASEKMTGVYPNIKGDNAV